ncbi:transcription initiation factor TFIID subunit 1 isoform X1 [Tanacetum coccineum]
MADDDDEYEDGSRLLEFMFGNIDGSGDLDIDYLDEDAKEHLASLADKLGSSLTNIDLSVKKSHKSGYAAEQDNDYVDYDLKAEDAVDYEDIDKQYEGPEVQALTEEDYLLPKSDYVSTTVPPVASSSSLFDDDDNYDEDEEEEEPRKELQTTSLPGEVVNDGSPVASQGKCSPEDGGGALEIENSEPDVMEIQKEKTHISEEPFEPKSSTTPLPVLCVEDGNVILRFSEIFAIQEPLKKADAKREQRWFSVPKEKYKVRDIVEDDEEAFLMKGFPYMRHGRAFQDEVSTLHEEFPKSAVVDEDEILTSDVDDQSKDYCDDDVTRFTKSTSLDSSSLDDDYFPLDQQDWENRIIYDNSPHVSERNGVSGPPKLDKENHVTAEPFGSNKSPESYSSCEETIYHPQLLRLESRVETVESGDTIKQFNKVTLRNKDLLDGTWMDRIVWDPQQSVVPKAKLLLDLQDEQMHFEVLDNKDGEHLQLHAGAMITTRSAGGDLLEPHGYGGRQSGGKFNISNDKFYSNRKSSQQQLKSHSKKRAGHGVKVLHSIPALKLQTMKIKLSNKDLAYFHRPKALWHPHENVAALKEQGTLLTRGSMKVVLMSLGGKGSKLHVNAEETVLSVKGKATKKLDFKPSEPVKIIYSGKELEDEKSLAEQDVRPNSLLHLVRTRLHLLPRAQKLPGENKSLRPPGAFKKKSDLSARDGHVFLMEYCEERPLLLGNPGMGARLCTYYQKVSPGDQTATHLRSGPNNLGNVLTLDPADKSPFLGDIKPGSTQSCLETNMYRAPVYPHKVSSTDYLLIRSAKGKLSLRRIDRIYAVGQQEPHMEVMSPASKGLQTYSMNRLLVFMYREFRACQKRGLAPAIPANELSALFANVAEIPLRKRLKMFCDLQRGSWVMKRNFRIPLEEELRRLVTPEHVCAFESMLAGMYRLKCLGISMTHSTGLSAAMNQLPDEAIALAAASTLRDELQINSLELRAATFVGIVTNQDRGNLERLEITGFGDPSGRGLGFSYVRTAPKAPVSNAVAKKKVPINRGSLTVTGTDADLRRLSMKAAREFAGGLYGSSLSTLGKDLAYFHRPKALWHPEQKTREKCQETWDRQVQNLSAIDGEENESDVEDLDSFAGDLENLLDAEKGNDEEESNHENLVGVKGLKMRRLPSQAQAQVEIEDEAAEGAELCRMLMDDDEAERKKKKVKSGDTMQQLNHNFKNKEKLKAINTGVKPMSSIAQPDGSFSRNENAVRSTKDDELFLYRKNLSGKMKPKKKDDLEQGLLNKKLKILNDGMNIVKVGNTKKNARDSFTCGACGRYGHMKTNKYCPKYRENSNIPIEIKDLEKMPSKSIPLDSVTKPQQKNTVKKLIPKSGTKLAVVEAPPEEERSSLKAKVLKVRCGPASSIIPEKATPSTSLVSDRPATSDRETVNNRSSVKVNKINIFSNKSRTEDIQVESHKPSSLPAESNIIRNPPRKTIVIRRRKEITDLDQISQQVTEPHKTKRMTELSGFQNHRDDGSGDFWPNSAQNNNQFWEENDAEQTPVRSYYEEERVRRREEQEKVAELRRFIKRERLEEMRQRENKKKKKNMMFEARTDYYDDVRPRRDDRQIPERNRSAAKRKAVLELGGRFSADYTPTVKRRRGGGQVELSNILEKIIDIMKSNQVSFLFLKPVTKKEAPDYLRFVDRPMDLATIKEKARKLEYKNRGEFRHDVCQITINAHIYNDGRNPGIPPLADQLLGMCDRLLIEFEEQLEHAEDNIEAD